MGFRGEPVIAFMRLTAMSRHSTSTSAASRPRLPRWLKVTVLSGLILANLVVAGIWWSIRGATEAFRENATVVEVADLATPTASTDPLYVLAIGSDSREGVDTDVFGDFGGARGDVIMVVRLDPEESTARILSIPRDTYVPIDGHGENKINAAYAYGGASLMVKTVRDSFDLPINHYVEVDFVGFQDLVDALGGVEMNFPAQARDRKSHLDVPAGTVTLDGFQALAYARSRSYQELQNGTWKSVDASDIGRAQRQQNLVLAILARLKRPSTLTESGTLVASVAQHLTVDEAFADSSLAQLAFSMRGIGGSGVSTFTLPTIGATRGKASVQLVDEPAASEMLADFRSGRPIDAETTTDTLSLEVLNANGVEGSAGRWAEKLTASGFDVQGIDTADRRIDTTEVVVREVSSAAEALTEELGFGHVVVGQVPSGVDAVVVLGTDAETTSVP